MGLFARFVIRSLVVAGLGLVACSDKDEEPTGCEAACDAMVGANCPNTDRADCMTACEKSKRKDPCSAESRDLWDCAVSLSSSDFACSDRGTATVSGDVCASEQVAYMACFAATPMFECASDPSVTLVIPQEWACDGEQDCENGADEANCE